MLFSPGGLIDGAPGWTGQAAEAAGRGAVDSGAGVVVVARGFLMSTREERQRELGRARRAGNGVRDQIRAKILAQKNQTKEAHEQG